MKPTLTAAALALLAASTPAMQSHAAAPTPNFDLPQAYRGYAQPEITDCKSDGLARVCTVPAMTAGRYLVEALGSATSNGADAVQDLQIKLGGAPCTGLAKPAPFSGAKGLQLGCIVTFLTDQPLEVSAVYALHSATAGAGMPKLVIRRLPWKGVVDARPVNLRATLAPDRAAGK